MNTHRLLNWLAIAGRLLLAVLVGGPTAMQAARGSLAPTTDVCGPIASDTTWTLAASPYVVTCDVAVNAGVTLTIQSGVVVKFSGQIYDLIVDGRLVAQGTEPQPIVFTSLKDDAHGGDTNGDDSATSPAPNDWGGIALTASSSGSVLEHTWIGYGGYGGVPYADANVHLYTSDVTMRDNVIAWSAKRGLYVAGVDPAHPLELTANTFLSNTTWAAYASLSGELTDVILTDNTSVGSNYNGFGILGAISGTVTYSSTADFPFIVWSDVTVQEEAALAFAPGTVVKFEDLTDQLIVEGQLAAQGTEDQSIVFTSLKDDDHGGDTNGNGSANGPAPNDWAGIVFTASSDGGVLEHTWIGYAGYGDYPYGDANVHVYTDSVTIRDNTIGWSSKRGIYVQDASPVIERNTIYANNIGVYTAQGSQPVLHENAITSNSQYGVYNGDTSVTVDAANNYWGASTGPYHATINPFGEGDQVSDYVLFTPWLEYPAPGTFSMDDVVVNVSGGVWFHPGEVASIRISYANLTTQTVESAVLVCGLPYAAYYVESTGGGTHWPEQNQVFWKLGDIVPGDAGEMWVTLRYMWGLPDEYHDGSIAIIGGTNVYTDVIDVASYLAYVPVEITGKTHLTEVHIQAERQQHPDLETFYTQAIAGGYVFGAAARFAFGSAEPVTQTILLNPDTRATLYLTIEGDQVLSSTFKTDSYAIQETSGGMTWDFQTDQKVYWGAWAPSTGVQSACGPSDGGCCLKNCTLGALKDATIGKLSKMLELIMKTQTCYQALQSREADDIADCATELTDKIPVAGEIKAAVKCIAQCAGDSHSNDCEKDKITCEKNLFYRFLHWIVEEDSYRIYYCQAGCYAQGPNILCATGVERCVPGKGCVDCTDKHGQVVDCHNNQFNRAKDPNAKYGPEGNLLPGQRVTYTITYENEGAGQAEGVFVVDELSEHFDVSTLTIYGGGEFYTGTRMASWYVGSLAPKGEPGSTGAVSFTVRLKDDLPGGTVISNQAVVHFPSVPEVTPTNLVVNVIEPVVALPQSLEAEAGQPIAITLQGVEVSGLPLTFIVVEEPMYGDLTGVAPTLVYTAMASFTGPDYFTFRASNGVTESEPAEVSILVNPWSGDTTPPEVSWTDPQNDAVVAEISATPAYTDVIGPAYAPFILVQFSEAISATTLATDTVQVVGDGGPPISITILYDEMLNRVVIIPREPLQDNTRYEVSVSQGVKDLMGNPMAADYTWHFDVSSVVDPIAGLSAVNDSPTQLGDVTTFTATVTAGSNVSYTWAFGDGAAASGAVITHTYQTVGPHTAVVTASNSINALVATTPVTITDVPIAGLSAVNDSPTQLGDVTAFTATVTAGSNVNYTWAFGDGATGNGAVTTHTYPEAKFYTATVTATNSINTLTKTTLVSITTSYHYIYLPLVLRSYQ